MYTAKSILKIAPVFLKKPERIEAMTFLYFIALMIVSLMERNIRKNMAEEKVEKLPILPNGMNTKTPTWNNLNYFFENVHLSLVEKKGRTIQTILKGVTKLHETVLSLLGVSTSVYTTIKNPTASFLGWIVAVLRFFAIDADSLLLPGYAFSFPLCGLIFGQLWVVMHFP